MISPRFFPEPVSPTGHPAPKYPPPQSDPALRTGINRAQRAKVTFSYKPVNSDELRLEVFVCCLFVVCLFVCLFVVCLFVCLFVCLLFVCMFVVCVFVFVCLLVYFCLGWRCC